MDDIIAYVDTNRHLKMWYAGMAELADALDSGSNGRKAVQVQVLLPAPKEEAKKDIEGTTSVFSRLPGPVDS